MFTPDELNAIRGIILEALKEFNNIYRDPSFYIGILSLIFSIGSFYQAKKAKEAAKSAARKVKTQEIIIEILRIINSCNIEIDVSYSKAAIICNEITTRILHLSGYFKNEENNDITIILKNIEVDLGNIRTTLNNNNPLIQNQATIQNQIYYSIEPLFTNIFGNLGRLQGLLENNTLNN